MVSITTRSLVKVQPPQPLPIMPVPGPIEPTDEEDEEVEEKLDQVLKVLRCHDPIANKPKSGGLFSRSNPNDHMLDMTKMDEKWFAARDKLRKAIAEMIYADECSWW